MEHEARVFPAAEQIELGAHEHGTGDRRAEGTGPSLDDEGEGVGSVIRAVTDPDGGSGFEEGAEVESELLRLAGNDSRLKGQAQYAEGHLGPQQWLLILAEFDRSFHFWCC